MHRYAEVLAEIRTQLSRLDAEEFHTELDHEFEPETGPLLAVAFDGADWHLFPADFLNLLSDLPDGVGPHEVKIAIEDRVAILWHGPSPPGSRDTSG